MNHRKIFEIDLRVDFGQSLRLQYRKRLMVEQGSTAKDVLSQAFPVLSGKTCCSTREVLGVNGIKTNLIKKLWWKCFINGDGRKVSPYRTKLKPGDLIEWKYIAT